MTTFYVEVFSLDTDCMDAIAADVSPKGNWCRRAWTDKSYIYVFNNFWEEARVFFVTVRKHAKANEPHKY
jgi:hypothetical protein